MPLRPSYDARPERPHRRLFWWAAAVAAGIHALLLWLVVLPSAGPRDPLGRIFVHPQPMVVDRPASARPDLSEAPETPIEERSEEQRPTRPAAERIAEEVPMTGVRVPTASAGAPEAETIAETGLTALRSAVLPLEATGYGIARRTVERDPERIAHMRAESLLNEMVASAVEIKPRRKAGPFGFPEGGGVSIPIPWGGFVRDDREDETWREERCRGKGDGKADKPGEAEGRRGQCS